MLREAHLLLIPGVCDEWRNPSPCVSADILVVKRPGMVASQSFARLQDQQPERGPKLTEAIGRERGCKAAAGEDDIEIVVFHSSDSACNLTYVNVWGRIKFP